MANWMLGDVRASLEGWRRVMGWWYWNIGGNQASSDGGLWCVVSSRGGH